MTYRPFYRKKSPAVKAFENFDCSSYEVEPTPEASKGQSLRPRHAGILLFIKWHEAWK